jgi:hypothetical protein
MSQDRCSEGLRKVFDGIQNPFVSSHRREQALTNERHIVLNIPTAMPAFFGIQLAESPKRETVVIKRVSDDETLSEVTSEPTTALQYWVDYEPSDTDPDRYGTAYIKFHSSAEDLHVYVAYTGMGSPIKADIINEIQRFRGFFPYFGGDGTLGDHTLVGNEAYSATPKQYRNLDIGNFTIDPASGNTRIVLAVSQRLTIGASGIISMNATDMTRHPRLGLFAGGGGGGCAHHPDNHYSEDDGDHGISGMFSSGVGGLGGDREAAGPAVAGGNGVNNFTAMHDGSSYLYSAFAGCSPILLSGGCEGGRGGGDHDSPQTQGGYPGGSIYIECDEFECASGAIMRAIGGNGIDDDDGYGGGSGGGSGGLIVIAFKKLIDTTPTFTVTGGTGGSIGAGGGPAGGDGSVGMGVLWRVREAA